MSVARVSTRLVETFALHGRRHEIEMESLHQRNTVGPGGNVDDRVVLAGGGNRLLLSRIAAALSSKYPVLDRDADLVERVWKLRGVMNVRVRTAAREIDQSERQSG